MSYNLLWFPKIYKKNPVMLKMTTTREPANSKYDLLMFKSTTPANTTPANISFDMSRQ